MSVCHPRLWVLLLAAGCGAAPVGQQCMSTGAPSPLVSGAQLLKLDVYPPEAQCDASGSSVLPGSAPIVSMTYAKGQDITVGNLPPGVHTVVLTAYADA